MRRVSRITLAVAAFALMVRVAYILVAFLLLGKDAPGGPPHDGYLEIAQNLLAGRGYTLLGEPNFFRPPTYVVFLLPFAAFPRAEWTIVFAQAILGAATCGLVTRMTASLVSTRYAVAAGLALALCPWHVHFAANGMVQVLAGLLVTLFTMSWVASRASQGVPSSAACGALYGASGMCHPAGALIGPAWVVDHVLRTLRRGRHRDGVLGLLAFSAAFAVIVAPWVVRNRLASGTWILFSNAGGFQYAVGTSLVERSKGPLSLPNGGVYPALDDVQGELRAAGFTESQTLGTYKGVAPLEAAFLRRWTVNHFLRNLTSLPRRLVQHGWWFWFGDSIVSPWWHLLYKVPLLVLAAIGVWSGLRRSVHCVEADALQRHLSPIASGQPSGSSPPRQGAIVPLAIVILVFWLTHATIAAFIPHAAYCLTVLPPLCVLAAVGAATE